MRLAFRAAPTAEAQRALEELHATYARCRARGGRGRRGTGRRRLHAGDAAPLPRARHPDLRHEPRHGRLPAQHLPRRTACSSGSPGRDAVGLYPLRMKAPSDRRRASTKALAINEVSIFRETRQAASLAIEIDGVCRMPELVCDGAPGGDPGRQHRLQPVRARADHPARRQPAGADPDQPVPAPPLARRLAAQPLALRDPGPRPGQAPGQRRRRLHRGPRRRQRRDLGGPHASRCGSCSTPSTIWRSGS